MNGESYLFKKILLNKIFSPEILLYKFETQNPNWSKNCDHKWIFCSYFSYIILYDLGKYIILKYNRKFSIK